MWIRTFVSSLAFFGSMQQVLHQVFHPLLPLMIVAQPLHWVQEDVSALPLQSMDLDFAKAQVKGQNVCRYQLEH